MEKKKSGKKNYLNYIILGILIVVLIVVILLIIKLNSKTKVSIDENDVCNVNVYDGNVKKLSKIESNEEVTVTNNEGTDAGEYTVTIKPNDGYGWSNNSSKAKDFICKIDKASSGLSVENETLHIYKQYETNIVIKTSVEGTISLNIDENIASISGEKELNKATEDLTTKVKGIADGKTNLQIVFTPTNSNYETETKNIEIVIDDNKVANIPTSSICNEVVANGKAQKLVTSTDFDGYTLTGQIEGTKSGDYTIEAVLKDGFAWSDGTTENKSVTCSISRYYIPEQQLTCIAGESAYINVRDGDSEDVTYSVKSISHNVDVTNITRQESCEMEVYKSAGKENFAIQASCIYPGRHKIDCLKPGADTITFEMNNGEKLSANITVEKGDTIKLNGNYVGVNCKAGKQIELLVKTYRDGEQQSVLQKYSIKNTKYATVSKSSKEATCDGCYYLTISCVKKGTTELNLKTKDGTTKSYPIIYR